MFTTGDGLLQIVDSTNSDGLKQIFATNLFGHFVLVSRNLFFSRPKGAVSGGLWFQYPW